MKYIVGNWKSNKNTKEVEDWFKNFADLYRQNKRIATDRLEIVICPPFVYLSLVNKLKIGYGLPIKIGVQDVSPFSNGAYTGEISANMLEELVEYVIIGHSERRSNFHEDDKMLTEKVKKSRESRLQPIYCVQDSKTYIPNEVSIVAYEPTWAIGTGISDTPESANKAAEFIKQKNQVSTVIYGGSVTPENINSFLTTNNIDGVLPGGASLDPVKFWEIIVNASKI